MTPRLPLLLALLGLCALASYAEGRTLLAASAANKPSTTASTGSAKAMEQRPIGHPCTADTQCAGYFTMSMPGTPSVICKAPTPWGVTGATCQYNSVPGAHTRGPNSPCEFSPGQPPYSPCQFPLKCEGNICQYPGMPSGGYPYPGGYHPGGYHPGGYPQRGGYPQPGMMGNPGGYMPWSGHGK